ncbi:GAF and ANTAR domain-containing protein [Kutzneria kofuensis]
MSPARLAETFASIADTLVDDVDHVEFARFLAARARETLLVAAAGAVLVDHRGQPHIGHSAPDRLAASPLWPLLRGDGPSMECHRTGTAIVVPDTDQRNNRWNRFLAEARACGFGSLTAVPLRVRETTIGALTVLRTERGTLSDQDSRIIEAMALTAAAGVRGLGELTQAQTLAAQLQTAFSSRIVIEQAKGVLAERHGSSVDRAFGALREYARRRNLRLSDLANAVVAGSEQVPPLPPATK